jgi:hypothetical protein
MGVLGNEDTPKAVFFSDVFWWNSCLCFLVAVGDYRTDLHHVPLHRPRFLRQRESTAHAD